MLPQEVVASIDVAVFIILGLVVIPLVYSYLMKGKETDNVSFHAGDVRERENWLRPGDKVLYTSEVAPEKVDEEFFKEQLEKYEERKRRSQPSQ